jgi:hypothetical protein
MIFCSVCHLPIIEESNCTRESCGHICHERCTERRTTQKCTECDHTKIATQNITQNDDTTKTSTQVNAKISTSISNITKLLDNYDDKPPPLSSQHKSGSASQTTSSTPAKSSDSIASKSSKPRMLLGMMGHNRTNSGHAAREHDAKHGSLHDESSIIMSQFDEPWWLLEAIIFCILGSLMLWILFEFEH